MTSIQAAPAAATPRNDDAGERLCANESLLRLLQADCQHTKEALEDICGVLQRRELLVGELLRRASGAQADAVSPTVLQRDFSANSVAPNLASWAKSSAPGPNGLRVFCLGAFEVWLGSRKVDRWGSLKARSLFKYLIAHCKGPTPKEVLMEALWPECDPKAGLNNLKAALHAARLTLASLGACENGTVIGIVCVSGGYLVDPLPAVWVDAHEFERLYTVGLSLERQGRVAEADESYTLAERLYRGVYMEDDLYENGMLLQREALKDMYLAVVGKLAERSSRQEDYPGCISYSMKVLAHDPCREDAYLNLMHCYGRLGQRSRALAWYDVCSRMLRDELEAVPDGRMQALRQRLLAGA